MKSIFLFTVFFGLSAFGFGNSFEDIQMKADSITKNKSAKTIELSGKAVISQGKHKLTADKIQMDGSTGMVMATGNCTYEDGGSTFKEPQMNLIVNGEKWSYLILKK